jgi:DNA-directed RNA polymerase specialized sigma24 family protein
LLSNVEYEVLIKHLINEETFKDISLDTRIPIGTVEWQYNNAIKKIKEKGEELNL